jgi:hypothetical protein
MLTDPPHSTRVVASILEPQDKETHLRAEVIRSLDSAEDSEPLAAVE